MGAQLSLEKTNLSLVKKNELKEVLRLFGVEVEKDEEKDLNVIFLSEEDKFKGVPAKCSGCGVEINTNNFGHLAHGSKLIYCKNPLCFNHYLALKKIKEVEDG